MRDYEEKHKNDDKKDIEVSNNNVKAATKNSKSMKTKINEMILISEIITYGEKIKCSSIRNSIESIEQSLNEIQRNAEKHKENKDGLDKFNSYYFPLLFKELKIYEDLEGRKYVSDTEEKTKNTIEKYVKMVADALKGKEDEIYQNISTDVLSDIQAATVMMKQDGLIGFREDFAFKG